MGKDVAGFSPESLDCLSHYHWPGNVRELQNEIMRALMLSETSYIGAHLFSARVLRAVPEEDTTEMQVLSVINGSLKERMETLEARVLRETLIRLRWNKTRAAAELGLSRVGLRSKLSRYGLEKKTE
jgi:two-component system response regulator HupR/HoxA